MTNPTYNIILDFDDVIYPFCGGIMAVLAEEGITGEITRWDLERDFGFDGPTFWEMVYQPKHHETLFLQPIPFDLIAQIRRLRYAGHRLHVVTAREGDAPEYFCREALRQNNIPLDSLTFTKDKGPMVEELDAAFSLDDGPHNYETFIQFGHYPMLMDAPHNRGFDQASDGQAVRRIDSMNTFANIVIGFQEADVQMRGALV